MKTLILTLYFFFACSTPECEEVVYETHSYKHSQKEMEVFNNLNAYRQSLGLNTLQLDETVSFICMEHNVYMISINKLTHEGFENRAKRIKAEKVSENLSRFYSNPVEAWRNSEGHRIAMEGNFNYCGIAEKDGYVTLILFRR